MTFTFGKTSQKRLEGVHPKLVAVTHKALEISSTDFAVICGVRSVEEQILLYAKGRTTGEMKAQGIHDVPGQPNEKKVTWTLNSHHFVNPATGFGHAVDLAPFKDGVIQWADWMLFKEIARAMKLAAMAAGVPLEWGGDWEKPDGPHFQLPKGYGK